MPTITIKRFTGGIDASVAPHELRDDQFREMENLMPSLEAISPRPTFVQYLTQVSQQSISGMQEYFWGPGRTTGAQTSGPNFPQNVSIDNTIGTARWANDMAARFSDDQRARVEPDQLNNTDRISNRLVLSGFGFNVPSNAQILGVVVEIERHYTTDDRYGLKPRDNEVMLRIGTNTLSNNRARPEDEWSRGSDRWDRYGSETDLWGLGLTPAVINDPAFSVVLSVVVRGYTVERSNEELGRGEQEPARTIAFIDAVRVTVYYRVLDPSSSLFGRELIVKSGTSLYTDRPGTWQAINTGAGQALGEHAKLRAVPWLGVLYIQDGMTGPWKYTGQNMTFSAWGTGSANPPPVAKFLLLDQERLYAAAVAGEPNAIRTSTVNNPDDWPLVAKPGSDKGMVMYVGKDDGDFITGLVRFASTKVVLKRRSIWVLHGTDVDTWQLRRLFSVGCESDEAWADMGFAAAFTDGERLYLWDGTSISPEFGLQIEPYLKSTAAPKRLAWWDGRLLVWYDYDKLVVWDSRYKAWYGPWTDVPASATMVRRDDGTLWLGRSDGIVGSLTGDGLVSWRLATKHYQFGRDWWEHMFRRFYIRGEGLLRVECEAVDGGRLLWSGSFTVDLKSDLGKVVGKRGRMLGLVLSGRSRSTGKLYEIAIEAQPVRAYAGRSFVG